MPIQALARLTPEQLHDRIQGFARRYVADWDDWLSTPTGERAQRFGHILRKWQATRPYTMRRTQQEGRHDPPFLEDLLAQAQPHLDHIGDLTVGEFQDLDPQQQEALRGLWSTFRRLSLERVASCVGISKAVLLLTEGRIGPSLDSRVRAGMRIERIDLGGEWLTVLTEVSQDIRAFQQENGMALCEAAPEAFRHLAPGRLYDMAFGPRERRR